MLSAAYRSIRAEPWTRKRLFQILGIFSLLCLGIASLRFLLSFLPPKEVIQAFIAKQGYAAPVVFIALFGMGSPFFVPNILFLGTACVLWPGVDGILLCLLGGELACLIGFLFARYIARDYVAKRIPDTMHRYDHGITQNAFFITMSLRFVFFLSPLSHWFFGLSSINVFVYAAGSFVGMIPGILIWIYAGQWMLASGHNASILFVILLTIAMKAAILYYWHGHLKPPESQMLLQTIEEGNQEMIEMLQIEEPCASFTEQDILITKRTNFV